MANGLDPVHMTAQERLSEVAVLLARGVRRMADRKSNHIVENRSIPLGPGREQSRHAPEPSPKGENA
jgi:hypothetical protein